MSDAVCTQYLDDASVEVVAGGVASTDDAFSLLQRYYAAHILSGKGGEGAPVSSESVDDVSTDYAIPEGDIFGVSWLSKYDALRAKVLGMEHRIL